ncbi:glutamyl aminopeptidase-like [Vespa velutina]|uniref:glutamyl aminopeptidase-like n=1 Tax=Vespa velutina TaxID=202808 RepID=UPI001FB35FD3|nr:glutamyl aminopeptidase-like [Vespa velutina]
MKYKRYFFLFLITFNIVFGRAKIFDKNRYEIEHMDDRLSKDIVPKKYIIAASPDFIEDRFYGAVQIDLTIMKVKDYIVLHSKNLTITSTKLYKSDMPYDEISIDTIYPIEEYEMIVIEITNSLKPDNYILRMNYSGTLSNKINGFYLSSYTVNSENDRVRKLAVTQFEPTYARKTFPCFDEPAFKSVFHIRIVHDGKSNYHALSNMPSIRVDKADDKSDLMVTTFAPTLPMSTYLVAFLISDFECLTSSADSLNGTRIPLSVCIRSDYKSKVQFALNIAAQAIEYYSNILNIDYALPKLDLVGIPDFAAGAMENWGLITFRETEVIYSEEHSSCENIKSVALTVTHELAHMWFGNLVTMKWWNDLWLNEGFATYMEHIAVDFIFPEWNQMQIFPLDTKYTSMIYDMKKNAHPIVNRLEASDEIGQMFDRISYQKSAAVINMLEDAIGNLKFISGIRSYLKMYQFANAESKELFERLNEETKNFVNLIDFLNRWTRLPGFPLVKVQQKDRSVKLSQERYIVDKKQEESFTESWDIPLKYITSRKEDGINFAWFLANYSCVELVLEKSVNWVKLNHNSIGYYIVNYTEDNWRTFTDLLLTNIQVLDPVNRADLLHDAFILGDNNDLSYHIVLNMTTYLKNESALQPWIVAGQWINHVNRLFRSTNLHRPFQSYVQRLIDKIYQQVGWKVNEKEELPHRELRVVILKIACSVKFDHCLDTAIMKLKNFVDSNATQKLHPDIRSIVYSYGLFLPNEEAEPIFEKMWEFFLREADVQEKKRLLIRLAAVRNKDILNKYLLKIQDEKVVRRQDFFEVISNIALNPVGLDIVWDFFRNHWENLIEKFALNDHAVDAVIGAAISLFKDEEKLMEVKNFFDKYPNIGPNANMKKNVIEDIESNIKWIKMNLWQFEQWLNEEGTYFT